VNLPKRIAVRFHCNHSSMLLTKTVDTSLLQNNCQQNPVTQPS